MKKNPGRREARRDRPGKPPEHAWAGCIVSGGTLRVQIPEAQLRKVLAKKKEKKLARAKVTA